jgi:hypothetical protein
MDDDDDDQLYWVCIRATLPNGKQLQNVYITCSHVVDDPDLYKSEVQMAVQDMAHTVTGPLSSRCVWEAFIEPYQEFLLN